MGEGVLSLLLLLLAANLGTGKGLWTSYQHKQRCKQKRKRCSNTQHHTRPRPFIPRIRPGKNLICYSCRLDFRKRAYKKDHPCLGRHGNLRVSEDYAVPCGPNATYCRVERTEVNGVLTMLRRECSQLCYQGCRLRGFGINNEVCEKCCTNNRCNHMYPTSRAARSHSSENSSNSNSSRGAVLARAQNGRGPTPAIPTPVERITKVKIQTNRQTGRHIEDTTV
ncbi:hypothetical protein GWK47_006059 [Chionoecetes opilio]|uniref:C2H2-type domain-containing protein n=1 Tax=Chionoecetes opilio TaxID=41210 RepID=A0A8J4YEW0_CHIOP|nr:hypothetical protein GWK47_006059 [Chionoecetes opilio]